MIISISGAVVSEKLMPLFDWLTLSSVQVLITIYWLGRAANSSATYNGPTLDLREFEGLLSQMRKVKAF